MRIWNWLVFFVSATILTAVFFVGFSYAYNDVVNPPQRAVLVKTKEEATPRGEVLIALGDSLTRGVGSANGVSYAATVSNKLIEENVVERFQNVSVSGARTEDLLEQLQQKNIQRTIESAKIITLTIGGNDLFNRGENVTNFNENATAGILQTASQNVESILQQIRALNNDATIVYVGLYNPFRSDVNGKAFDGIVQQWNNEMRQLGLTYDVQFVDTFSFVTNMERDLSSDQFHPNDRTYNLIADAVYTVIKQQ